MRYSPPSPGNKRPGAPAGTCRQAFTLIELLVALSVMTLALAMFSQMLASVLTTWVQVKGGVDNFAMARGVLDSLEVDLSKAVIRRDLGAFGSGADGSPLLSFYTERSGLDAPTTDRQLQLVSYSLQPASPSDASDTALQRSALQVAWTDPSSVSFGTSTSLPQLGSSSANTDNAAEGVLGLAVNFRNAPDGSLTPTFTFGSSQAVTVTLAVLAGPINQELNEGEKTALQTQLTNAAATVSATASVETLWDQFLNNSANLHGYPVGTASGIHVFSRTYWLPIQGVN